MNPICGLFLVTLLASAPAIAEPFDKTQVDAAAAKVQIAEQRVVCFGNRQCRTVDVKPARAGCRRVSTGGRGRGNAFKVAGHQCTSSLQLAKIVELPPRPSDMTRVHREGAPYGHGDARTHTNERSIYHVPTIRKQNGCRNKPYRLDRSPLAPHQIEENIMGVAS
jgi:hypothetical protein